MGVSFNDRVGFRLYLYLTILLHLIPLPDILILLTEIFLPWILALAAMFLLNIPLPTK